MIYLLHSFSGPLRLAHVSRNTKLALLATHSSSQVAISPQHFSSEGPCWSHPLVPATSTLEAGGGHLSQG